MLIKHPQFETGKPDDGGSGGTTEPNEVEVKELETLVGKDATTLTDVEKTRLAELQSKYEEVVKGPDGKPLTPEQINSIKEVETKVNTILSKDPSTWTPEEKKFIEENTEEEKDKRSIYEQVDEAKGAALDIDYGDVAPDSVDGIILREETIAKSAVREYDNTLKEKYPRAYQLMLHLAQGGKEEDFYKPENADFKSLTITKEDKAGQENVLRIALAAKGNSSAIIEAVITSVKDSAKLYETAKDELEKLQATQAKTEQERVARASALKKKEDDDFAALATSIETAVTKGFEGIVVPEKDKKGFLDFLSSRIDYSNGNFYVAKPLNAKEIAKELKYQYFEFKGGDLKGLIEREAKSQNTRKLKNSIQKTFVPKGTSAPTPKFTPISQL